MGQGIAIKDKAARLIAIIVLVGMVSLMLACASDTNKAWFKYGATQEEFAKDKYDCEAILTFQTGGC